MSARKWKLGIVGTMLALAVPALAVAMLEKPYAFEANAPIRASEFNSNFDALFQAINGRTLRENQTLEISPGCEHLTEALLALQEQVLLSTATVTLKLAEGNYACAGPIIVRHPNATQIEIVGAGALPQDVTLTFPASSSGFDLLQGLGKLANLKIAVAGASAAQAPGTGIGVVGGSATLNDVIVQGFHSGIAVQHGAMTVARVTAEWNGTGVRVSSGRLTGRDVAVRQNTGVGVLAEGTGSLSLIGTTSAEPEGRTLRSENNGAEGYRADGRGTLDLTGALAMSNVQHGFSANSGHIMGRSVLSLGNSRNGFYSAVNGTVWVASSSATPEAVSAARDNTESGFYASYGGAIVAQDASAIGNGINGFYAFNGSRIHADRVVAEGNGQSGLSFMYGSTGILASITSRNNGSYGLFSSTAAFVRSTSATYEGNTNGETNVAPGTVPGIISE